MIHATLGSKIGQTQEFTPDGKRIPVTRIQAGPCWVISIIKGDTYQSLQLGFGNKTSITKALAGHIKKAGLDTKPRFLREIRLRNEADLSSLSPGSQIKPEEVFAPGDSVRVTGTSKGKGFAGVVKRHGFRGGPRTHGQSDRERAPGSIGQTTTPGRVYRGKRMAGRMGGENVTVRGLKVIHIDPSSHVLTVKGLVPGPKNSLVMIAKEA